MLVLTRYSGQSILLFQDDEQMAEIKILSDKRNSNQVKIGIDASDDITILRDEVYERVGLYEDD